MYYAMQHHITPVLQRNLLILLALFAQLLLATAVASQPGAYLLGTGDKIQITVFGEEDLSVEARLTNEATIAYPLLGEISLAGKTASEAEQFIIQGLKGRFLVDPKVTVTVAEYRQFFINGEVNKPGGYAYLPGLTLHKAVALAGGLNERASKERMSVIREHDTSRTPVVATMDTVINPGDIVNILEFKQVFIHGEVEKPGSYEFQPGLTLRKAIALAGGMTARAAESRIKLIRDNDPQQKEIEVSMEDQVNPGDIITIGRRFF